MTQQHNTICLLVMFVFDLVSQNGFCHSEWVSNVGKVCQGLAPKIIHIHESSRDKTNPTSTTSRTKSRLIKRISVPDMFSAVGELELTGEW